MMRPPTRLVSGDPGERIELTAGSFWGKRWVCHNDYQFDL